MAPVGLVLAPTAQAQVTHAIASVVPQDAQNDPVACNCYLYVKSLILGLPRASELKTNTTPHVGAVVIFDYDGLPHYGVITSLSANGFELKDSNFRPCRYMTRHISWSDAHIRGFWSP